MGNKISRLSGKSWINQPHFKDLKIWLIAFSFLGLLFLGLWYQSIQPSNSASHHSAVMVSTAKKDKVRTDEAQRADKDFLAIGTVCLWDLGIVLISGVVPGVPLLYEIIKDMNEWITEGADLASRLTLGDTMPDDLRRARAQIRYVTRMLTIFWRPPEANAKLLSNNSLWVRAFMSSIASATIFWLRHLIFPKAHFSSFGAALVGWIVLFVAPVGLGYILSSYVAKILRETMVLRLRRNIARAQLYINNGVTPPGYVTDNKLSSPDRKAHVRIILELRRKEG